jgi:hypothetical protein
VSLPASLHTVTVTGRFETPDGIPQTGTVTFDPAPTVLTSSDVIVSGRVSVTLDATGSFSAALLATDEPAVSPSGWTYTVTEDITGRLKRVYPLSLPYAAPTVALSAVAPASPASGTFTVITGPAGPQGAASSVPGPTGPAGPVGLTGPQGIQGIQGLTGYSVLSGTAVPDGTVGNDGDVYLQYSSTTLFTIPATTITVYTRAAGAWTPYATPLKGATWYANSGSTTAVGSIQGDLLLRTDSGDIYQRSAVGWGSPILNIKGTDTTALVTGMTSIPRLLVNSQSLVLGTSGSLRLTYFTAPSSQTLTQVRTVTGSTAAGATPTLCRIGLYSVNGANGNLTLVASTPNDTTLFAAASTAYTKSFSSSVAVTANQRYALGIIVVSAAALPTFVGAGIAGNAMFSEMAIAPRLTGVITGQADLPASLTDGALTGDLSPIYAAILP